MIEWNEEWEPDCDHGYGSLYDENHFNLMACLMELFEKRESIVNCFPLSSLFWWQTKW